MSASQSGVFNVQQFADAGAPLVNGRLYTYAHGTTTHKDAYTDVAGDIPQTYTSDGLGGQYIALNSRGELVAPLYLASGSYDLVLKRSDGSAIWTRRADGIENSTNTLRAELDEPTGPGLLGYDDSITYGPNTVGKRLGGEIYVYATGVEATDVPNLIAAISRATTAGKLLRGVGNFHINALIQITCDADFKAATFTATNPSLPVIVEIRAAGTTAGRPSYFQHRYVYLPNIVASTFPFTGVAGDLAAWAARGEGVRIHNCISCEIHIPGVYGFGRGVRIAATGAEAVVGCSWNAIYYGKISNNLINFVADPRDANGFCNENMHFGGRFCHESPVVATAIPGCYHLYIGDTGYGSNSQKFYGSSIEGDQPEYHVLCKDGYNLFDHLRWESYSIAPKVLFNGNDARGNIIRGGALVETLEVTETAGAIYNHVVRTLKESHQGGSTVSTNVVGNTSGNYPILAAVPSNVKPHTATFAQLTAMLGDDATGTKLNGDTTYRFRARSDGKLEWGSGSANSDTFLSRLSPGILHSQTSLRLGATSGPTTGMHMADQGPYSYAAVYGAAGAASNGVVAFYNGNGVVGSITTSGSATSFNTSSDYRLKENVVPLENALSRLMQLKPSRFNFKADPLTTIDGFLAHEAQEVVPECAHGVKDEMETLQIKDDEGTVIDEEVVPKYQGMDAAKLVPLLVAALQELKTDFDSYKAAHP